MQLTTTHLIIGVVILFFSIILEIVIKLYSPNQSTLWENIIETIAQIVFKYFFFNVTELSPQ